MKKLFILAALLIAAGSASAQTTICTKATSPGRCFVLKPIPRETPNLQPAFEHADEGDARTLQQAQEHADQGDAATLGAATKQIATLRNDTAAGIAQSAALVHIEPWADGQTTVNVGVATYGGQTAVGLAVARQVRTTTLNLGIATAGSGRNVVRVGMGWRF